MKKHSKRKPRKPPKRRSKKAQPRPAPPPPSPLSPSSPAPAAAGLLERAAARLRAGDARAALPLCRQALKSDPGNADALNLAGAAAFQSGLAGVALDLLQTAVTFAPGHAEAGNNLGNVLAALGREDDAEAAYRAAIAADPDSADPWFNMAQLMERGGRNDDALAAYRQAADRAPGHAGARLGLGNALKALGRLEDARAAYLSALALDASSPEVLTNLAAVFQELGDFEGAADHCRRALKTAPDLAEARYNLGIALQEKGDVEDAIAAYERVLTEVPGHGAAALNMAVALQQTGRLDDSSAAFRRVLHMDPDFAKAAANFADLRLEQGKPGAALAVCDEFLARRPADTAVLAYRALALGDSDLDGEARALVDLERFLKPRTMPPPDAYRDLALFNEALARHVEAHPSLSPAPQSHATREARHSGELKCGGPMADLEAAIRAAADAYRRGLGNDPGHPWLAAAADDLTLSVWGVVMEGRGHQIPHIHPAAWLSGVYYVRVPDFIAAGAAEQAGWIEFGRPPDHFHNRVRPETRAIRPEEGLMILFPSYFYHRTIPFRDPGTRVSIAFDLMAA